MSKENITLAVLLVGTFLLDKYIDYRVQLEVNEALRTSFLFTTYTMAELIIGGAIVAGSAFAIRGLLWCMKKVWKYIRDYGWNFLNVSLKDDAKGALSLIQLLSRRGVRATRMKAVTIKMPPSPSPTESGVGGGGGPPRNVTFYIPASGWTFLEFADVSVQIRPIFEREESENIFVAFEVAMKNSSAYSLPQFMDCLRSNPVCLNKQVGDDFFGVTAIESDTEDKSSVQKKTVKLNLRKRRKDGFVPMEVSSDSSE